MKRYSYIIIGVVGVAISAVLLLNGSNATQIVAPQDVSNIATSTSQPKLPEAKVVPVSSVQAIPAPAVQSAPTTTIVVAASSATSYTIPVLQQENVLDAMNAFASSSSFTFTGRDYPGLGFFVESIGGKASKNGYNWMLYVDGVQSPEGASSEMVAPGDTVEWRYEQ